MTAVNINLLSHMLQDEGFSVVILEHDFGRLTEWQGINGNVIFCAHKVSQDIHTG